VRLAINIPLAMEQEWSGVEWSGVEWSGVNIRVDHVKITAKYIECIV